VLLSFFAATAGCHLFCDALSLFWSRSRGFAIVRSRWALHRHFDAWESGNVLPPCAADLPPKNGFKSQFSTLKRCTPAPLRLFRSRFTNLLPYLAGRHPAQPWATTETLVSPGAGPSPSLPLLPPVPLGSPWGGLPVALAECSCKRSAKPLSFKQSYLHAITIQFWSRTARRWQFLPREHGLVCCRGRCRCRLSCRWARRRRGGRSFPWWPCIFDLVIRLPLAACRLSPAATWSSQGLAFAGPFFIQPAHKMSSRSVGFHLTIVRGIRFLLCAFVVWWTADHWFPLYGVISALIAGFALAMFAEAPFGRISSVRNIRTDASRGG